MRHASILLLCSLLCLTFAIPSLAQTIKDPPARISLAMNDKEVNEAIRQIFETGKRRYRLDSSRISGSIIATLIDIPFDVALRVILTFSTPRLTFRIENGVYILFPQPASVKQPVLPIKQSNVLLPSKSDSINPELVVQKKQNGLISSIVFSPNGKWIASESGHEIRILDIASGKEFRTLGDYGPIAFNSDGTLLASHNKIWEVASGRARVTLPDMGGSVGFSQDGRTLIRGSWDFHVGLTDVFTGKTVRTFGELAGPIAYSPAKNLIAAVMKNDLNHIQIWNASSGNEVAKLAANNRDCPKYLSFSSDGNLLISLHSHVRVWNVTNQKILREFEIPNNVIKAACLSPDGSILAFSQSKKSPLDDQSFWYDVSLWNVASGTHISTFTVPIIVDHIAFSPDGKLIATAQQEHSGSLWKGGNGRVYSDDSIDQHTKDKLILWDTATGQEVRRFGGLGYFGGRSIFTPDGRFLFTGSDTGLKVWNVGMVTSPKSLPGNPPFDMTMDGKKLLWMVLNRIGLPARILWQLYNRENGEIDSVDTGDSFVSNTIALSPDGKYVAVMGLYPKVQDSSSFLKVYEFPGCTLLWEWEGNKFDSARAQSIVFSSDSRIVAVILSGHSNGISSLRTWASATGKPLSLLNQQMADAGEIVYSPDGRFIAGETENGISLWNAATGSFYLILGENLETIRLFNRDSTLLASASQEGRIRIWDVRKGNKILELSGPDGLGTPTSFSADGRYLSGTNREGTTRLWDLKTGKLTVSLIPVARNDYIAATPDGYYMASKGAVSSVAFRIGNEIFPFEQFDLKFNRPDIVLERLGYAPKQVIDAYKRAYEKRLKKMQFSTEMLATDFHLPEVSLNYRELPTATNSKQIKFKVQAKDTKYKLDRLLVYDNDVPVLGMKGISLREQNVSSLTKEIKLELTPGRNKVQISVLNSAGAESLRQTFEVVFTDPAAKPDLYVVAIGVSEYRYSKAHPDKGVDLKYAAKDAGDIAAFLEGLLAKTETALPKGKLIKPLARNARKQGKAQRSASVPESKTAAALPHSFQHVHVLRIVNGDATRENVQKAHDFLMQSKPEDHVIVFLAGHGMLDKNLDYYFCTTETDPSHLADTALPYESVESLLDGIPSRQKLLLMDTCHSGEVDKDEPLEFKIAAPTGAGGLKTRAFGDLQLTANSGLGLTNSFQLLQEKFADLQRGSGALVISAAGGVEAALENEQWKNGAFTSAVLEGLKGRKADKNKDGRITVSELRDYVVETVQKLTKGIQKPTSRRDSVEFDFYVD